MIGMSNLTTPLHTIYRPVFGKNIVYKPLKDGQPEDVYQYGNVRYVLAAPTHNAAPEQLWFLPGSQDPVFLVSVNEDMTYRWDVEHPDLGSDGPCSDLDREAVKFFGLAPYCL